MADRVKKFRFSGHQTFPFRYGWLEKGVRGVVQSSHVFNAADALVVLGVGKNMVDSIRYWCLVTQLIKSSEAADYHAGELGSKLLGESGWDAFAEDEATLWLLHWLLVSNPDIGTTGQILFGQFHRPDFSKTEFLDYVVAFAEKQDVRIQRNILARDVDCFLRCYARGSSGKKIAVAEDTFDCPFQELNLIQPTPDGDLYHFSIGPKASLPAEVFGFALLQYCEQLRSESQSGARTLSIQECMYGIGSPGQAFKLDENSIVGYVEELEEITDGGLVLDETAGLKQIYERRQNDPNSLLSLYYSETGVR